MSQIEPYQRRTGFSRPQRLDLPVTPERLVIPERFEAQPEGDWDVTVEYEPGARAQINVPDGGLTPDNLDALQRWIASRASSRK